MHYIWVMKEISQDKFQISASVQKETVKSIQAIAEAEKRDFSPMVDILLAEAIDARRIAKNGLKTKNYD